MQKKVGNLSAFPSLGELMDLNILDYGSNAENLWKLLKEHIQYN